jgi:hypothetical protein
MAQHYGLPTRLLDWTELPFVAAFFAVCERPGGDGTLCALSAGRLNTETVGMNGVVDPVSGPAYPLFQRPFDDGVPESDRVVAVVAHEVDARMMVQRAAFTIHGASAPPLEDLPNTEGFLMRFDVPAKAKEDIWKGLVRFGVRWSSIFPDLENLSRDIAEMSFPPD